MARLLFLEPLAQGFHECVPAAERLDAGLLLIGQLQCEVLLEPVRRHSSFENRLERDFRPAKVRCKDAVVAVEVAFVLDEDRACHEIELVNC